MVSVLLDAKRRVENCTSRSRKLDNACVSACNIAAVLNVANVEFPEVQEDGVARKKWERLVEQARAELQGAQEGADKEKQERLRETERVKILEREVGNLKQETATLPAKLVNATALAEQRERERLEVMERASELKQGTDCLREELQQLRNASCGILESITRNGYWIGNDWVESAQLRDAYRESEKDLRRLLEKDSPHVKERAVKLFDTPWGLKALKDQVWKRLSAALGEQYALLSSRVITNDTKSGDQVLHRGVDLCESPPVLLVFMLPLVEVTADRGPTEVFCPSGSVLMTTKLGAIYGFDTFLEHRVQVGRNRPHDLRMVPAIVIGNSSPLYGERAFQWLKRESQVSVKPFALGDQASPIAGINYTFLDEDPASVGVDAPPATSLDALVAQRNAESVTSNDVLCMYLTAADQHQLGIRIDSPERKSSTKYSLKLLDIDEDPISVPRLKMDSTISLSAVDF
ncbi:hypothetical protein KFL_013560020 [Klebsormidium nitens]|uniref:Uncharacterized protein n=1 Tax=Klebsormidium nitens TaxID=105231 RepID=A0A1Y1IUC4_KLENI|nr:hypothetical protein KFL_013560020 [Klebsormidium nitens]|eukprot:GAQ93199.1 hypothetical protein KFL_013560020 [Klebsormidium nitens]